MALTKRVWLSPDSADGVLTIDHTANTKDMIVGVWVKVPTGEYERCLNYAMLITSSSQLLLFMGGPVAKDQVKVVMMS